MNNRLTEMIRFSLLPNSKGQTNNSAVYICRCQWQNLRIEMISRKDIKRVCAQIARGFRPQRIILFGSYAYGKPTPDSDVDLLVIMPFKGRTTEKAVEISSRLEHRFPIDLLVRSPEEVRQRLEWNDFFLREVTEKGVVMYDSTDA